MYVVPYTAICILLYTSYEICLNSASSVFIHSDNAKKYVTRAQGILFLIIYI